MAYDIIVDIMPVIAGTLQCQGPWPAFAGHPDFADQGPLTDMDMEENAEILSLLLKHIPSCIDAADIEQLVQDIPVQPSVVVPVRTVQEAVAAGDLM